MERAIGATGRAVDGGEAAAVAAQGPSKRARQAQQAAGRGRGIVGRVR
jgi:hypothetical protein